MNKNERVGGIRRMLDRRRFLQMVGAGAAGTLLAPRPYIAQAESSVDCPVVMFHQESSAVVDRVIKSYKNQGREAITASELVDYVTGVNEVGGRKFFSLTFDDGYLSQERGVVPLLEAYEIKATFFVLDPVSWWGDRVHSYVDVLDIQRMHFVGMDIQSHGISHQNLVNIAGSERYWADLLVSKREIGEVLDKNVDIFCYPFGAQNERVRQDTYRAGYRAAFSTVSGNLQSGSLLYRLLRRRPS